MLPMLLQQLLQPVKKVLEVPFKRIVKYAIKSSLGRYLRNDLRLEQFFVNLATGKAQLCDIELDTDEIQKDLRTVLIGLPFRIGHIFIEKVMIEAFGGESDGLSILFSGVRIVLEPVEAVMINSISSSKTNQTESSVSNNDDLSATDDNGGGGPRGGGKHLGDDDEDEDEDLSQAAQDGLRTLGDWIEEYAARLRIVGQNVSIELDTGTHCLKTVLNEIKFYDATDEANASGTRYKSLEISKVDVLVHDNIGGYEEHLLQTSGHSMASLKFCNDVCTNFKLTIPWIHSRIAPRSFMVVSNVLDCYLDADKNVNASSLRKQKQQRKNKTKQHQSKSKMETSMYSDDGFFDAEDGGGAEDQQDTDDNVGDYDEDEGLENNGDEDQAMVSGDEEAEHEKQQDHLEIQIEILRCQIELLYDDPMDSDVFLCPDKLSSYLNKWLATPEQNIFAYLKMVAQEIDFASRMNCQDRLVIRIMSSVFRAEMGGSIVNSRASLEFGKFCITELLAESPLFHGFGDEKPQQLVHVVLDMDTTTSQAVAINFVKSASLVVRLAPILLSWDNAMAERLYDYLPTEQSGETKVHVTDEEKEEDVDSDDDDKHEYQEGVGKAFKVSIVSSKVLMVCRVPSSFANIRKWKQEALLIDMTNVEAKTGTPYEPATKVPVHTSATNQLEGRPKLDPFLWYHNNMDDFYSEVEDIRNVVWSVVVDFSYSRACIVPVPTGIVQWQLAKSQNWALSIGASTSVMNDPSRVALPRLGLSVRKPLVDRKEIEHASKFARERARNRRRAFKNRVHQRRAPGEEGRDDADPAGDHDLDKDRDPPIHEVIEAVAAHGFATADSCVRIRCPTAAMRLDCVQYHSMNAMLQLIVGTIPSFTRPSTEASIPKYSDGKGDDESNNNDNDKQPHIEETGNNVNSGGDDFWETPQNTKFNFDLLDDQVDLEDMKQDGDGIVDPGKPAVAFFRMESNEGRVEIIDEDESKTGGTYQFDYFGMQISLVDAKTMIESLDVTLSEYPKYTEEKRTEKVPVFYSTKWGRHSSSPPLIQVFIDSAPESIGDDTTIVNVSVESLTLRYDPRSTWFVDLTNFITSSPPPGSIMLFDSGEEMSPKSSSNHHEMYYTELTVEFFDSIMDYRPLANDDENLRVFQKNGAFLSCGLLRVSSNIATPAVKDQSYHFTARDLALYITNDVPPREPYDHVCTTLLPSREQQQQSLRSGSVPYEYSSLDDYCGSMLYAKIGSLDMMEVFIRIRTSGLESEDVANSPDTMAKAQSTPEFNYEVAIPHLSLYTCTDSLATLNQLIQSLSSDISVATIDNEDDFDIDYDDDDDDEEEEEVQEEQGQEKEEEVEKQALIKTEQEGRVDACQVGLVQEEDENAIITETPDDEKSASQLKQSYLDNLIPDDQLSGPQLRSRHIVSGQLEEPDSIFVDGFYAVESMEIQQQEEIETRPQSTIEAAVTIATTTPPVVEEPSSGVWFDVRDDQHSNQMTQGARRGSLGDASFEHTSEYLLWGDDSSGVQEIELDEFQSKLEFGEEDLVMQQVREDARSAEMECHQAAVDFASMIRQERVDLSEHNLQDFAGGSSSTLGHGDESVESSPGGSDTPTARWYSQQEVRIYPHYMGIPYEAGPGSHVPPPEALAARQVGRQLNVAKGKCETRFVLRDMTLQWFLFGGCDWNSTARAKASRDHRSASSSSQSRRGKQQSSLFKSTSGSSNNNNSATTTKKRIRNRLAGRIHDKKIEILFKHISAFADFCVRPDWVEDQERLTPYISEAISLAVRDFVVIDRIESSEINQMVCEWVSESLHPRITGSSMLGFAFDRIRRKGRDTMAIRVSLLPLKVNIDQDALDFLMEYLSIEPLVEDEINMKDETKPEKQQPGDPKLEREIDEFDDDEAELEMLGSSASEGGIFDDDLVIVETADWVIESFDVRAFKIRVDYRPKRVDLSGIMEGDRLALVNLFAYEGLEVALKRIELQGVSGWHQLTQQIQASWLADVNRQRHKCLAGVAFPPINTVASLGSGLTDLVMIPLEQYQRDGRIMHGVRRGTAAFVRTVVIQALGTFSKAALTAQSLLEHARDVFSPLPAGTEFNRQPALPPATMSSGAMLAGTAGASTSSGETDKSLAAQPKDFHQGLEKAADSLAREMKRAAYVLVALPYDEFQRSGTTGAVKSVLRGVPIAVIRPLIGATEAMSSTLIGLRNTVDRDGQIEVEQKYKTKTTQ